MLKKCLSVCLSVTLLVITLYAGSGLAESAGEPHLYQQIPMQGTTPDEVSQLLLEKTSAAFTLSDASWSGYAYGIEDFGYPWNLQLDFNENYSGVERILLSSAQSARVAPDEFSERLSSDLQQFIDVETQLTALYGEPDARYFFITGQQDGKTHKYMFQSGTWELNQMLNVCDESPWFWAYSLWNNVMLKAWVDWESPNVNGNYLSRVMLYYYPAIDSTEGMLAAPIEQYPCVSP